MRSTDMNQALRIVVVSTDLDILDPQDEHAQQQAERSRSLRIGLLESGFNLVASLPGDVFLTERLAQLRPDLIIVDAESDARDALEHVVMATRDERRPIVMFTNDHDSGNARAAVAAGVTAYIVAGLQPERIRPILDVAMARFQHEQALRKELADARSELNELSASLQERKVIDRAKALLMERQKLSENDAYAKLRKAAMDKNMKIVEVAQRMLDVADLMG
jgi:response regulator NasT